MSGARAVNSAADSPPQAATESVLNKCDQLVAAVTSYGRVVVALSGGVDSAVVAKAAQLALGDRALAVTGTSASLINLEAIKRLPVEAPPVETQARITKIHQLSLREKELMEAIQNKRRELIEMILLRTIGLSAPFRP